MPYHLSVLVPICPTDDQRDSMTVVCTSFLGNVGVVAGSLGTLRNVLAGRLACAGNVYSFLETVHVRSPRVGHEDTLLPEARHCAYQDSQGLARELARGQTDHGNLM